MTRKFLLLLLFINCLSIIFLISPWKRYHWFPPTPQIVSKLLPTPPPTPKTFTYPTIDSIFTYDHSWTQKLDSAKTVTLIATGDVIPARTVNFTAVQKNDFSWSYKNIADLTKSADITFVNLETPLIQNCPATTEGMV